VDDRDISIRLTLKVERAKKHFIDLESEWCAFLNGNPYVFKAKDDVNKGKRTYYLFQADKIPDPVPLIIGDVLHNLRCALDHLAYHLATLKTKVPEKLAKVYFPIFKSATAYKSGKAGKIDGIGEDAIKAIDRVQPYGGGDGEILWLLHTLNIADKHKFLVTTFPDLSGHSISPSQYRAQRWDRLMRVPTEQISQIIVSPATKRFPLKAGDALHSIPQSEVQQQMKFLIIPAFGEPKIVEGRAVIPLLHEMIEFVRGLIFKFSTDGLLV
jgi:hypothetical protein